MIDPKIQDYIDQQIEIAKGIISRKEEYHAKLFHVYQKGDRLEFLSNEVNDLLENDFTKSLLIRISYVMASQKLAAGSQIICAFLIADAYFSTQKVKPEDKDITSPDNIKGKYIQASKAPARREGIMVSVCLKDDTSITYYPYITEVGKVVFQSKESSDKNIGGHFSKLFPPEMKEKN